MNTSKTADVAAPFGAAGMENAWYDGEEEIELLDNTPRAFQGATHWPIMRWPMMVVVPGALNEGDIQRLDRWWGEVEHGDSGEYGHEASVHQSFIEPHEDVWLYSLVLGHVLGLNRANWHFDIRGFTEPIRALEYRAGDVSGWHADYGVQDRSKLTFVVMLSNPDEYEGGQLEILNAAPVAITRGDMVVFPSHLAHRVTPITGGRRRVLAGWLAGPAFK